MKMKLLIIAHFLLLGSFLSIAQVRIKMQKEGGVYKIPCVVNGLRLKFVFDTGATNVCISLSEANLMLENGYLDKKDIVGKGASQIADGSIINNTKIILREVKINGLILNNVEAVVINELSAPLLLGQTAIEKLGKIQLEGDDLIVLNANDNNLTEKEIDEMFTLANNYYNDKMFAAAADIFQKLYDMQILTQYGILKLADSYYYSQNKSKALNYYLEIQNKQLGDNKEEISYNHWQIFDAISNCYYDLKDYPQAELYIQKSKLYLTNDFQRYSFYSALVQIYNSMGNCYFQRENIPLALEYKLKYKGYLYKDIFCGKVKKEIIASDLFLYGIYLIECGYEAEGGGMMCFSAKYGENSAIKYCESNNLNYKNLSWVRQ